MDSTRLDGTSQGGCGSWSWSRWSWNGRRARARSAAVLRSVRNRCSRRGFTPCALLSLEFVFVLLGNEEVAAADFSRIRVTHKKNHLIGEVRFVITFTAFIRYSRTSARWRAMASNPFAGEPTFGTEPTYAPPGTTRTSMQSAQSEHSVPLTMSQPPVHVPPAKMGVLLFHILFKALALVVYMTNVSGQYVLTFVLVRSAELAQRRPLVVVRPCSLTAPCCFCRPDCLSRL